MIEDPYPPDWKALQAGVARLFNEIGLTAKTEEKLTTPRGEVEIDVLPLMKHRSTKFVTSSNVKTGVQRSRKP